MDGIKRKLSPTVGPTRRTDSTPTETQAPAVETKSKGWAPKSPAQRAQRPQTGFSPTRAPPPRAAPPPTKEQLVQEVLKDGPKGAIGEAVEYWDGVAAQGGVKGAVGKVMGGLLEVSGLPAVERSASELGARVGIGDSNANIAKAGAKLAFDSGVVLANGLTAGRASMAVAGVRGTEAAALGVVRHYTSAATAERIMQSGEIWASKLGNAGVNKVYLLAEGDARGMNVLRRLNIGYGSAGSTAKAIEFDLAKMPPDIAERFSKAVAGGALGLENFVTHSGTLNFEGFRGAVKVLDTEAMSVTMAQLGKAGATLGKVTAGVVDAKAALDTAAK